MRLQTQKITTTFVDKLLVDFQITSVDIDHIEMIHILSSSLPASSKPFYSQNEYSIRSYGNPKPKYYSSDTRFLHFYGEVVICQSKLSQNYYNSKYCNLAKEFKVGDTLVLEGGQYAVIKKFVTPSTIIVKGNLTQGISKAFYALDGKNGTIKWESNPKWPELQMQESEVGHQNLNLVSKQPILHLLGVGDFLAFSNNIFEVTGFQLNDTEHIIQVLYRSGEKQAEKSYFIGKNASVEIESPGKLFKSNFQGNDRGLVQIEQILEIVRKEEFTNIETPKDG